MPVRKSKTKKVEAQAETPAYEPDRSLAVFREEKFYVMRKGSSWASSCVSFDRDEAVQLVKDLKRVLCEEDDPCH